jgi:hypothetical protein
MDYCAIRNQRSGSRNSPRQVRCTIGFLLQTVLGAVALATSSVCWADAAADKAGVDLQQAKINLLKSEIPAPPDKSLTPSVPAAPALNASADKNVYKLSTQLATSIVAQLSIATADVATTREFAIDDGKTRASIGVYKAVVSAIGASTDAIQTRTAALAKAVAALSPRPGEQAFVAPLVIAGAVQAAIGYAELFKTQYSFGTTSQKDAADAALAAAMVQELRAKQLTVIDPSLLVAPCLDVDVLAKWQIGNPLVCGPKDTSSSLLATLTGKLIMTIKAANDLTALAADQVRTKEPADAKVKNVVAAIQTLQTSVDDANKMLVTLNVADASGNASFDIAQRTEPLMMKMNAGVLYFVSAKAVAMDSDVVVDTRWYSPLEVSMESVLLAQWQLSDSRGKLLGKKLECVASGRRAIALRVIDARAPHAQENSPANGVPKVTVLDCS